MILPDVHECTLDNGFRALLVRRATLPVVASMVWYQVGSRDERSGETGLSHFLEHMMFKGTDRYKKGEIDHITSLLGGSNNAFTDNDVTAYYFSLASDRWEQALEIEASRMRGCLLDTQEFAAEKQVVLEELAMGEDDPWRSLYQALETLTFSVHPYHHPVIGWKQDVAEVSAETMREYYRRHYAPDRAFMVAVGDLDIAHTETRIQELFGGIAPSGVARRPVLQEPAPQGERRAVIRAPGELTRMGFSVRTCRMGEPDDFALDILSAILASSKGSRLHQRMVAKDRLLTEISTYNEPRLDPGVFWITCELRAGVDPQKVERVLREELEAVATGGVTASELKRAKLQLEAAFLFEEETALDSAMKLGRWEAICQGGYKLLSEVEARYAAVDKKVLKELVARVFTRDNWNVVLSLPEAGGQPVGKRKAAKRKAAKKASKKKPAEKKPAKKKTRKRKAA